LTTLTIVTPDGRERSILADGDDLSLMEVIRAAGFDDLLALCGGCCSCATCHVYIAPEGQVGLPPVSETERDLLESSAYRRPESRLSCQIPLSGVADGLRVEIAPEE
jgi:2Fe-2S ferredoxin